MQLGSGRGKIQTYFPDSKTHMLSSTPFWLYSIILKILKYHGLKKANKKIFDSIILKKQLQDENKSQHWQHLGQLIFVYT